MDYLTGLMTYNVSELENFPGSIKWYVEHYDIAYNVWITANVDDINSWYSPSIDLLIYRSSGNLQIYVKQKDGGSPEFCICAPNDLPDWGTVTGAGLSSGCGNFVLYTLDTPPSTQTRSQTWGLNAAIQADREKAAGIKAYVALTDELPLGLYAAIAGNPSDDVGISAYIQGDTETPIRMRAAIKQDQELPLGLVGAVAAPFDLPLGLYAAIAGNPDEHCHIKAAILGETEISVGIVAYVVKSRIDTIILEMENLFPQELDLRSTPNWRSRVKDWRTDTLGE